MAIKYSVPGIGAEAVYGSPAPALATLGRGSIQISPLIPDATSLEDLPDRALNRVVMAAPAGTIERRYALAQALRALKSGGELIALAPKDKGGLRLRGDLALFGCSVSESARRHHRIVVCTVLEAPIGVAGAIADGGPQIPPRLGLWSQPGVFSWDRPDPGTGLLLDNLPSMTGRGADLGCGVGVLGRAVLTSPKVSHLSLIDIDARAVAAARRNIGDPRAAFEHADVRGPAVADLDFVVMNPPFHEAGHEDRALGQAFIAAAAARLRPGGVCWMVANVGLPYDAALAASFSRVTFIAQARGYKVWEARK